MEQQLSPLTAIIDHMGVWHISLFAGYVLCLGYITQHLARKFSPGDRIFGNVVAYTWAYAVISCLYYGVFPATSYGAYSIAFQATAGQTLAALVFVPGFFLCLEPKHLKYLKWGIEALMIWEISCLWLHWQGVQVAPSFDSALLAAYVPFAPGWLMAASIVTALSHHGSTAFLILAAQLGGFAYGRKEYRKWLLLAVPVLVGVAFLHSHGPMLDGIERLEKWDKRMSWWAEDEIRAVIGTGAGSFLWLSMDIDQYRPPLFLMMHSDWLQILFEYGIFGLVFVGMVVWEAFRKTQKRQDWVGFSAVAGACAFGLTYHPLRFFPSMFVIGLIFYQALFSCRER